MFPILFILFVVSLAAAGAVSIQSTRISPVLILLSLLIIILPLVGNGSGIVAVGI